MKPAENKQADKQNASKDAGQIAGSNAGPPGNLKLKDPN